MQQDLHKVCEAARILESMCRAKSKLYPKGMTVTSSKGPRHKQTKNLLGTL